LSLNAAVVGRVGAGAVDDRVGDAAEVLLELEEGDSASVRGRKNGVNTQTQVQVSADCLYVSPSFIDFIISSRQRLYGNKLIVLPKLGIDRLWLMVIMCPWS